MSISKLSNYLYVVVTTIISLLVALSPFHQARARPGSHAFTESRQFKRNLAVSKYRDHPHWLPNYTWKPPEKFYGPRKRPTWVVDAVTESKATLKEQEELKEWEKKMRDVSNRQREKWKTYETVEKSEHNTAEKALVPAAEFVDRTNVISPSKVMLDQTSRNHKTEKEVLEKKSTGTEKVVQDTFTNASDGWNENIHNGRWGMSAANPASKGLSTDSPRTLEKTHSISQPGEGTIFPAMYTNGRWGMSVKKAPTEFRKELSRRFQTSEIAGKVWKQDPKSMGNRKIHDRSEIRAKEVNIASAPAATKLSKIRPSSRWGMCSDFPPREFLREISRCGLAGFPKFYRLETVHEPAHGTAKNNPQSWGLMFSQVLGIPNIVFLPPLPSVIRMPAFHSYLIMYPRIRAATPDYNVALFSYIIG